MSLPYRVHVADTTKINRSAWLGERRGFLGASDAPPALRMSPWVSDYALWADKRGLLPESGDTERFWWGRALEPLILARWSEQTGVPILHRHRMLVSREHPHMAANPDGEVANAVLEAKTADGWDERRWDEGIPDHYALQGQHLMIVTGHRRCIFPVLFGYRQREFVMDWDQGLADLIIKGETEFWQRVTENDPPDPDGSESAMQAIRGQGFEVEQGVAVELPAVADEWARRYREHKQFADEWGTSASAHRQKLILALRGAEIGTVGGEVVVTYKQDKRGVRTMRFPTKKAEAV